MGAAARRVGGAADGCLRPRGGRGVRRARAARWLSRAVVARFASRAAKELRREMLSTPLPELGLVAANGPNDPEPELVVEDGVVVRMDGRAAAEFDVIDRFLVAHGLDLEVAAEAMALSDLDVARRLVDVDVPRAEIVRLARGLTPAQARARRGAARPGRADVRAEEAARPPRARESGARDQPEGEPRAPRSRCRRGGGARLRRARDDGRRRALRAAQRDLAPRRLADRTPGRDDPVRGRGAAQPRARDQRPRHLRGDALGVRHGAGLRRRRRHALVEVVPRRRVRVARSEGALHVGHRLGGADGARAGNVDALPRGALHLGRARRRLAGRAERLDLLRRARALAPRRDARDPGRERDRRLARPRGRLGERRDRLALRDPQDGEADGAVPSRHRLRHLRLLGDAAPRQHVRRRQLRRRRPRRVDDDPARLAGRRWHRAGRRGRGDARARPRGARDPGGIRRARPARRSPTRRSRPPRSATTRATCPIATAPRTSTRPTRRSSGRSRGSTSRSRSTGAGSTTSRARSSTCSGSACRPTTSRPRR